VEAHSFWLCDDNFISVFILLAAMDLQPLIAGGCHMQDRTVGNEQQD
jgi:hypothetical protein